MADVKAVSRVGAVWLALVIGGGTRAHGPEDPEHGTPPLGWALPAGLELVARAQDGERLDLFLEGKATFTEGLLESIVRAALDDAFEAGLGVTGVVPWVRRGDAWVPAPALLPEVPPVPPKPFELKSSGPGRRAIAPVVGSRRAGALAGKVVYVSAGHGFTWDPSLGRWTTQRGNTHDIVEDLVSAETIDQLLTTYLENAGATVFTVRERDTTSRMVIVDAQAGGARAGEGEGAYRETGSWQDSTGGGFAGGLAPYVEGENPFALGASRVAPADSGATATWSFTVPEAGDYRVYAAWVAGANRAPDAHYIVRHAGGEAHFHVDQRRHGGTWMSLGRFRFDRDGAVELVADSAVAGSFVSADAMRIGGGMGDVQRGDGSADPRRPTSGRPRWEENARYHVQFTGAPQSVYRYASDERSDDVGARSRYAAWQNETGEDAVYVAWHTNAPSPGVGTSTFVYGPNPPDGSYDFTGTPGSDDLGRLLHDEVVNDLKAAIDPAWRDRGLFTAYFGELNKNHNPEMPSALCEVAFHATESDAARLKEPRMRQVAARAFYQAIARYFAERDGRPTLLLPEPPEAVRVVAEGQGARLSWAASPVDAQDLGGDAATGYRIYRSRDGLAFDEGVDVSGTSHLVTDLAPGTPAFFRVTAFNDGGESLPSPVVAVSLPCEGGPRALVVHGFYRLDAGLAPREDLAVFDLGTVVRGRLWQMNRFDGVVAHAWALARAGLAFDSTEATALGSEALTLEAYGLVDWVLGEESTADETLSDAEQGLVSGWLGPGRTLLVSGAELAWDLGEKGSASDQAFLASLGASFAADDAGTYELSWDLAGGGALALDDGTRGAYDVQFPDVLTPVGGAETVLTYAGGAVAGVRKAGAGVSIVLGVPLEAVFPEAQRDAFVAALVEGAGVARTSGCGVEPGPEADAVEASEPVEVSEPVEPVESVEVVEPSPDAFVEVVDSGDAATPGRPGRQATSTVREVGGGCISSPGGSSVSIIVIAILLSISFMVRRGLRDRAP